MSALDRPPIPPAEERPEEPDADPTAVWVPVVVIALMVAVAVFFVASSLDRPEPPTYRPTPPSPADAGDTLVGPSVYTVDARDPGRWRFFDFSRGSVVDDPGGTGWDLAFKRNWIGANGGEGFVGRGGIVGIEGTPFDSVESAPAAGYLETGRDTINAAVEGWYDYSWTSHLLTPAARVYVVRTADGRYAKLEILSYYCPDAVAGCMTFRYVYQGSGSRELAR